MAVLMALNNNGQAISLSKKLNEQGVKDGTIAEKGDGHQQARYTFAQTFPTGTHAMWLYYWLAANNIDPFKDAKANRGAAAQMVANHARRRDGRLLRRRALGQPRHRRQHRLSPSRPPRRSGKTTRKKTLGTSAEWVAKNPNRRAP